MRFLSTVLMLSLVGCGGGAGSRAVNAPSLVTWIGEDRELFADGIDVSGLAASGDPPTDFDNDAKIPARVQHADGVVRSRVVAVSREPRGERGRYRLEFAVEGEPLSGRAPTPPFILVVDGSDPAFGSIRAAEQYLVGRHLVVFYKAYVDQDLQPVLRFHLSPASRGVLEAIHKAATIKQFD